MIYPAMNHQQGDLNFFFARLPVEVESFSSGESFGLAGTRRGCMSLSMRDRYRLAMTGKGWLSTKDVATAVGVTRKAAGCALRNALIPQGYVEQRALFERKYEYRWKGSNHNGEHHD